jgi:hypothetical protein
MTITTTNANGSATDARTAELQRLLAPTSTTRERVRGVLLVGVPASEIAKGAEVSVSALRNWAAGQTEPRTEAAIFLDDLREVVKVLLDGGIPPVRTLRWLTSRNEELEHERPIDLLRERPIEVISAAHGVVLDDELN